MKLSEFGHGLVGIACMLALPAAIAAAAALIGLILRYALFRNYPNPAEVGVIAIVSVVAGLIIVNF